MIERLAAHLRSRERRRQHDVADAQVAARLRVRAIDVGKRLPLGERATMVLGGARGVAKGS